MSKVATRNSRGEVSGYTTEMPFCAAMCWKKPFSEQLSPVHVRPDKKIRTGTLCNGLRVLAGGRYTLRAISHDVVDALWVSLSSFPPKDAIVALVVKAILKKGLCGCE